MFGLHGASKVVRKNVANLTKTADFYLNRAQRGPLEHLLGRQHTPAENLALHLIGTETPANVFASHLDRAIAEQAARAERAAAKLARVSGAKQVAKATKMRTEALRAVEDLNGLKALLPETASLLRDVPAGSLRGTPYESGLVAHELTPVPSEAAHGGLHPTYLAIRHADAQRVAMAKNLGRLDDATEVARRANPGRVYRGARWRPGEEMLPKDLRAQRARVTSLQTALDDSLRQDAKQVSRGTIPEQAPGARPPKVERDIAEAQAEVTRLRGGGEPPLKEGYTRFYRGEGTVYRAAEAITDPVERANWALAHQGRRGQGWTPYRPLAESFRRVGGKGAVLRYVDLSPAEVKTLAWKVGPETLHILPEKFVTRAKDLPGKQEYQDALARLREAKAQRPAYRGPEFTSRRTRNLRGALNLAENKLASMEKAHITRTGKNPADYYGKTAGFQGAEHFTGGRFYIPSTFEEAAHGGAPYRAQGQVLPKTAKPPPGFRGQYTGEMALRGAEAMDVPQVVARSALGMQRSHFATTRLQELQRAAVTGEHVPEDLKGWQAVKLGEPSRQAEADLRSALQEVNTSKKPSVRAQKLVRDRVNAFYNDILPEATRKSHLQDQAAYGFVPEELVGERGQYSPIGRAERIFDQASHATKLAVVFTKVGHIPVRFVSNGGFIMGQQGWRFVGTAVKTRELLRAYPELGSLMDAHMGHGSFAAIADTRLTRALVRPVERFADRPWRRAALVYEVQKDAGRSLSVPELAARMKELFSAKPGSELAGRMKNIDQRGAVHAGEYGRMSSAEKRFVSKILFLWTWHRTAAVTTAKFALEHPIPAAGVGAGTYYLNERLNRGRPPWELFSTPAPGLPGKIMNWSTSIPTSTPAEDLRTLWETGRAVTGLHTPAFGEGIAGQVNPLVALLYEASTHRDIQTGKPLTENAFLAEARRTPIGALVSGKRSWWERGGKYVFGNPFPQTPSGGSSAGSSKPGSITPGQLAQIEQHIRDAQKKINSPAFQKKLDDALKKLGQ